MFFMEILFNLLVFKDCVVCFDCEMGYIVCGLELIWLIVISWLDGKELFDVIVCFIGEVFDFNLCYFGVWF